MLRSLIAFCLSRRLLVMVAFAAFLGLGYTAFLMLNIEAYPDPAPPIIEIIAQQQGQSPEEVERYITIPIEVAVASPPGLKFIRSNTVYGLGFIRLQFEYGRDYHFVRQQTLNRLKDAVLPAGVLPVISPAGGISEIFRYELTGPPGMDVMRLKALQDWVVERKLRIVPGVADVAVLGGKTKEFHAEIDLDRMMAYGLTLPQIMTAISAGNSNVGGRTIAIGEQSVNVRSIGVITSMEDIGNIVVTQQGGVPVLVSDVAKVQIGYAPRLGLAGRDEQTDVVTGIVLMQKLERTMDVVRRVRAAVERINTDGSLPPGVKIVTFYDRGDLVAITVRTVLHNLLFGCHHDRSLPAAFHDAGCGRSDLRADGADLCLCVARCRHRDLHGDAGAVVDPAAGACPGSRNLCGPSHPRHLPGRAGARSPQIPPLGGHCGVISGAVSQSWVAAWHRIPAQAGRGQSLDPSRDAADHHARSRDGYGGKDPHRHLELSAGPHRVFRARTRR